MEHLSTSAYGVRTATDAKMPQETRDHRQGVSEETETSEIYLFLTHLLPGVHPCSARRDDYSDTGECSRGNSPFSKGLQEGESSASVRQSNASGCADENGMTARRKGTEGVTGGLSGDTGGSPRLPGGRRRRRQRRASVSATEHTIRERGEFSYRAL